MGRVSRYRSDSQIQRCWVDNFCYNSAAMDVWSMTSVVVRWMYWGKPQSSCRGVSRNGAPILGIVETSFWNFAVLLLHVFFNSTVMLEYCRWRNFADCLIWLFADLTIFALDEAHCPNLIDQNENKQQQHNNLYCLLEFLCWNQTNN